MLKALAVYLSASIFTWFRLFWNEPPSLGMGTAYETRLDKAAYVAARIGLSLMWPLLLCLWVHSLIYPLPALPKQPEGGSWRSKV